MLIRNTIGKHGHHVLLPIGGFFAWAMSSVDPLMAGLIAVMTLGVWGKLEYHAHD